MYFTQAIIYIVQPYTGQQKTADNFNKILDFFVPAGNSFSLAQICKNSSELFSMDCSS